MLRLSDGVERSIDDAIAGCGTVADISALLRKLVEKYPELRYETDSLAEILVAKASTKGLAIRFES